MKTIKMILIGTILGLSFTMLCAYTMVTPQQVLTVIQK